MVREKINRSRSIERLRTGKIEPVGLFNWLLFIGICLIGGSTWLAIKLGLQDSMPLWSSSVRFIVAGTTVCAVLIALGRWRLPRHVLVLSTSYGVFFFSVPYGAVYWAELHVPSGLVAVLASTLPVLLLVLGHLFYGIRATLAQSLGVILAVIGVAILFWHDTSFETSTLNIVSMAAVVLGMVSMAATTIVVRPYLATISILAFNAVGMIVGGTTLGVVSLLFETGTRSFSGQNLVSLLYLALMGSTLALWADLYLLKVWHMSRASAHFFISPAIALYLGAVILNESLGITTYLGTVVVLLGVVLINLRRRGVAVSNELGSPRIIERARTKGSMQELD